MKGGSKGRGRQTENKDEKRIIYHEQCTRTKRRKRMTRYC